MHLVEEKSKACTRCGEVKVLSHFGNASHHADGRKSNCRACESAYHAAHYKNNREKISAKNKAWCVANPEKRLAQGRRDRAKNPEKWRKIRLWHTFKLTLDQYNEMFQKQGGCCAICGTHQSALKRVLCVDHDHENGKIRELLCSPCNKALGLIYESRERVIGMLSYIDRHRK